MRAKEIREYLDSLPIASSHSHHLPDHEHLNLSLAKLLQNSYVAEKWIGNPTPTCAEEVDSWLERIRNRNFFIYLGLAGAVSYPQALTPGFLGRIRFQASSGQCRSRLASEASEGKLPL